MTKTRTKLRTAALAFAILFAIHGTGHAQGGCITGGGGCAPEVDPSLATGALALLGGTVLLLRARRK